MSRQVLRKGSIPRRTWWLYARHKLASLGLLVVGLVAASTAVRGAEVSCKDFRFEIPPGWVSAKPDQKKTAAMLLLYGKSAQSVEGMLKVDFGPPALPTAMDTARTFAGKEGTIQEAPGSVDGADGIRVRIPTFGMESPSHVVVIYRAGRMFLIMCAGTKGVDVTSAFDHVIRTWRWSPQYAPPTRRGDNTVECNGFVVKYQPLANAVPIPGNTDIIVGAWKLESAGLTFIFGVQPVPAGVKIIEADFVTGFEEMIGVKVGKLKDYSAGGLAYREAYVDVPAQPGAKVYTAHYWREGICIKVQGSCVGKDTDEGLRLLRQFLAGISVIGSGPPPAPGASQPAGDPWSSHELSKKLGGYGLLLLIAAGIIVLLKRKTSKPGSGPDAL